MANRFCLNPTSYHGFGAIENIVPELVAHRKKKALIVTDNSLVKFGVVKNVTDLLDKAGFAYDIYDEVKPNPTIENVTRGVEAFKKAKADA
ncbi:MAG: iron-containing alcohol dehydrogenase, partial [Bacilli bacterium]|nr:iron-containing alcohol dehydrogenase [Bacilli bacterium]